MRRGTAVSLFGALVFCLIGGTLAALQVDELRWRIAVVQQKAAGNIDDLSWAELVRMLTPGSGYYLQGLADNPNPFSVIANPWSTQSDRLEGEAIFKTRCAGCHGMDGRGSGKGTDLIDARLKHGASDWALYRTIERGITGTSMVAQLLDDRERWQVVGYIAEQRGNPESKQVENVTSLVFEPLTYEQIKAPRPRDWPTYSGGYPGWRYSALDQISRDNVASLGLLWALQLDVSEDIEATPIALDGTLFLTAPPSDVLAVNGSNGETIWKYEHDVPDNLPACCGRVNRGVAILDDAVFLGTLDSYLVALDAATGKVRWSTKVAEHTDGYTMTGAPLAVDGKIIVGVAGGEYGIRGFLDAYDAQSGDRIWRFHTVPGPGEYGRDTWSGDSWKTGGGPTWVTGSFDAESGVLYWGVGNPSPDFNGSVRLGDNLFTNAVVALDVNTGERLWHFQFTPHDEHDWDANQTPVLMEARIDDVDRKLLVTANRNGYYYALDRTNGELISARAFGRINWSSGIDANGRPILTENATVTEGGTLTWPGANGATNWWPPSFNPKTELFYAPFLEQPRIFFRGEVEERGGNSLWVGGGANFVGDAVSTGLKALDPVTGELVWEWNNPTRVGFPVTGGVLSSSAELLFYGDGKRFHALDGRDGTLLWSVSLGGRINAAPMSYAAGERQVVVIPAGNSIFAFALPEQAVATVGGTVR